MSRKPKSAAAPSAGEDAGADLPERGGSASRAKHLRLRAAWMYFVEDMRQSEIADRLGVGRITVVRLLSDARERGEIQFNISRAVPDCVDLERELETAFGLTEAIVVPLSSAEADATLPISAATGSYLMEHVRSGMKIGVGWGRTLLESLSYMEELPTQDVSVVSLLGGITRVRKFNPSEFAWRFSRLVQAECYLLTAPAIVDSAQTRRTLIERCGLAEMFEIAKTLDTVLLSIGAVDKAGTAYRDSFVSDEVRRSMIDAGAVGEVLFNYFDADGFAIEHPIHDCVMNVPISTVRRVPSRIMASGGHAKSAAIYAALKYLSPTVLITDEHAARHALALHRKAR